MFAFTQAHHNKKLPLIPVARTSLATLSHIDNPHLNLSVTMQTDSRHRRRLTCRSRTRREDTTLIITQARRRALKLRTDDDVMTRDVSVELSVATQQREGG